MKPSGPGGTTVTLNEYAWATEGMAKWRLDWWGKDRLGPPARLGGPKAPVNPWVVRVSTMRQGVIPTKTRALVPKGKLVVDADDAAARCSTVCDGCQYSGAAQCLRGTGSYSRAIW